MDGASLTVVPALPASGVVVSQSVAVPSGVDSGGIQVRWLDDQQFRGLTQTFVWRSDSTLATIGLRVSTDQNQRYKFAHAQKYVLDVQELGANRTVLQTLASIELTLEPRYIQPDHYFVIALKIPIKLRNQGSYGFNLRPAEANAHNHIIVSTGGNGKGESFADGVANQTGVPGLITAGARYGNAKADFDLTFFLSATGTQD